MQVERVRRAVWIRVEVRETDQSGQKRTRAAVIQVDEDQVGENACKAREGVPRGGRDCR